MSDGTPPPSSGEAHSPKQPISTGSAAPDGPVTHASRRRRKKPRVFEVTPSVFARKPNTGSLGLSGTGMKLSSIPRIAYQLRKAQPKEPAIELLHRVMFNSQGAVGRRILNIRKFSGFVFRSEVESVRTREKLVRTHLTILRRIMTILDIPIPSMRLSPNATPSNDNYSANNMHDSTSPNTPSDDGSTYTSKNNRGSECENTNAEPSLNGKSVRDLHVSTTSEPHGAKTTAQKRDTQRVQKETIITTIMDFLKEPKVMPGRENLGLHGKAGKRSESSKNMEQSRDGKVPLSEKQTDKARKLGKGKRRRQECSSDSEGIDEDIETNALPWIEIARRMRDISGETPTDGNATRSSDASNSTA